MILWSVGGSIVVVWFVFRSAGVDYRMVAIGSLLPLAIDVWFGRPAIGHTLVVATGLLVIAMLATVGRGRRRLRRRLLGVPIGMYVGLVLTGAFADPDVFWWPIKSVSFPDVPLLPAWPVVVALELVGAVACGWVVTRFDLVDPERRAAFVRTGRLDPPARDARRRTGPAAGRH